MKSHACRCVPRIVRVGVRVRTRSGVKVCFLFIVEENNSHLFELWLAILCFFSRGGVRVREMK